MTNETKKEYVYVISEFGDYLEIDNPEGGVTLVDASEESSYVKDGWKCIGFYND